MMVGMIYDQQLNKYVKEHGLLKIAQALEWGYEEEIFRFPIHWKNRRIPILKLVSFLIWLHFLIK